MAKVYYFLFFFFYLTSLVNSQILVSSTGLSLSLPGKVNFTIAIGEPVNALLSPSPYVIGLLQPQYAAEKPAIVKANNDTSITVYEFVSANNDGQNDYFEIKNIEKYTDHLLTVFDGMGTVVFQSRNYDNKWQGGSLPPDNYFYVLRVPSINMEYKGALVITK